MSVCRLVEVDGTFIAEERYSTDYVTPQLQETQEVLLFFASESNGSIAWGVLLPTRSCKAGERYAMEDVGMFMHWALGNSHDFSYHKSRGQFHSNLVAGPPAPPPDMSSYDSVRITMPNVPVVLGEGGSDPTNPYVCGWVVQTHLLFFSLFLGFLSKSHYCLVLS